MIIRSLVRDQSGSSAAEFGLTLPLLVLLLFGVIDAGRWIWTYNQAEKATQMGARLAVVTKFVDPEIGSSYVGGTLVQGDVIPASAFGKKTCAGSVGAGGAVSVTCTCTAPCKNTGSATGDAAAFSAIVARMKMYLPSLTAANVTVEYSSSGLGYAGSPVLPDLSPLVTVKIGTPTALRFRPITILAIRPVDMPAFTTTLSAEDLSGSVSN